MDEDLLITWKEHTNASVSLLFVQRYFWLQPRRSPKSLNVCLSLYLSIYLSIYVCYTGLNLALKSRGCWKNWKNINLEKNWKKMPKNCKKCHIAHQNTYLYKIIASIVILGWRKWKKNLSKILKKLEKIFKKLEIFLKNWKKI